MHDCKSEIWDHSHVPKQGLTAEDKLFVREKFEEGITKPNALLDLFRKKQRTEPARSKLTTYLRTLGMELS